MKITNFILLSTLSFVVALSVSPSSHGMEEITEQVENDACDDFVSKDNINALINNTLSPEDRRSLIWKILDKSYRMRQQLVTPEERKAVDKNLWQMKLTDSFKDVHFVIHWLCKGAVMSGSFEWGSISWSEPVTNAARIFLSLGGHEIFGPEIGTTLEEFLRNALPPHNNERIIMNMRVYFVWTGDIKNNTSLLHHAATFGTRDNLKYFLDKGCYINLTNGQEQTPLMSALLNDKIENALFLIDQGADLGTRDIHDNTPLKIATKKNMKEILEKLEDQGIYQKDRICKK